MQGQKLGCQSQKRNRGINQEQHNQEHAIMTLNQGEKHFSGCPFIYEKNASTVYPIRIVFNWGNARASVHIITLVFHLVFRQS